MKVYAIPAQIFKGHYGDCSNDGISNRFEDILIIHPEGFIKLDTNDLPENVCDLETITDTFGNTYLHLIPKHLKDSRKWVMFGGCFAWSSDSRFRNSISEQPVQIHDRVESW